MRGSERARNLSWETPSRHTPSSLGPPYSSSRSPLTPSYYYPTECPYCPTEAKLPGRLVDILPGIWKCGVRKDAGLYKLFEVAGWPCYMVQWKTARRVGAKPTNLRPYIFKGHKNPCTRVASEPSSKYSPRQFFQSEKIHTHECETPCDHNTCVISARGFLDHISSGHRKC